MKMTAEKVKWMLNRDLECGMWREVYEWGLSEHGRAERLAASLRRIAPHEYARVEIDADA